MTALPRTCLLRAPNWLGDCIMALPVLDRLQEAYPGASLVVAVRPHLRACFEAHPAVSEIVDAPARGIRVIWESAAALRGKGIDTGILLPNSLGTAFWLWHTGIPMRIGYTRDARRIFLTHPVRATPALHAAHQSLYYLHLLTVLGIPAPLSHPTLHVSPGGKAQAEEVCAAIGVKPPYTVTAPMSAYGAVKDWPAEAYAEACAVIARTTGRAVLVTGTAAQRETCAGIARADGVYNVAGMTDLAGLFGLMEGADRFFGGDSGGAHAAAALGKPTVSVFGITEPSRTCALGRYAVSVGRGGEMTPDLRNPEVQARARAALASIPVEEVLAALDRAVEAARNGAETGRLPTMPVL